MHGAAAEETPRHNNNNNNPQTSRTQAQYNNNNNDTQTPRYNAITIIIIIPRHPDTMKMDATEEQAWDKRKSSMQIFFNWAFR